MNRSAVEAIRKLDIQDGDVLVVPEGIDYEEVKLFMEQLRTAKGVMVVLGPLDRLSEQEMNAAGWYRK